MNLSDWSFFLDGFEPLPCRAPCTMYSVLLENGKIPDPFYGVNEQTLRHLGERDCAFETEFTVDDRDLVLSDNYFDLTAPEAYTVTAQTQASAAELLPQLTVKTVYDIR